MVRPPVQKRITANGIARKASQNPYLTTKDRLWSCGTLFNCSVSPAQGQPSWKSSEGNLSTVLAAKFSIRTSRQNRSRWLKWANVCLENKWHRMFMKRTPVQVLSIGRDWSCFRVVLHREKWLGRGKNGFNKIPTNPGCNHNTIEKQAEVGRRIGVYESIMTLNTP